jgi:hypothetical protein
MAAVEWGRSVHALVPIKLELLHEGARHQLRMTWDMNPCSQLRPRVSARAPMAVL